MIRVLIREVTVETLARKLDKKLVELDKQRRFLQTVIDGVGDPIQVIGKDYTVILANKRAKEFSLELDDSLEPRFLS